MSSAPGNLDCSSSSSAVVQGLLQQLWHTQQALQMQELWSRIAGCMCIAGCHAAQRSRHAIASAALKQWCSSSGQLMPVQRVK
jgi:hypothetical protein